MYEKSNAFGIASKEYGPSIRSFRFLGEKSAIYFHYTEDFSGNFEDKWEVVKHPNPVKGTSDSWNFFVDPKNLNSKGELEKIEGIKHTGDITAKNEFNYGSWAVLKNAEWANGTVKFNMLLRSNKPIALFFRYKDQNNYYSLIFNQSLQINNIILATKIEGNDKSIKSRTQRLKLNTWYRITVDCNFDDVKITMQTDNIREHKVLFEQKLEGLHRGTIAFAAKGI